jgi:steroid 5-alpha reductase family enzyme
LWAKKLGVSIYVIGLGKSLKNARYINSEAVGNASYKLFTHTVPISLQLLCAFLIN